jgi:protein-S-isoprenylcysteine O-methyltransferase Ste14
MFGMLLGTGVLVSRWESIVVGALFFHWGTMIRIRIEERLLRAAFGAAYENYARKVQALIPRWPDP